MLRIALCLGLAVVPLASADPKPAAPKLALTKIDPAKGDADGGTYVRLIGSSFLTGDDGKAVSPSAKIYFGSRQGTIVRFASDTEVIVQAPGGKVGEVVDVLVIFEGRGELKLPKAFTFVQK